MKLKNFLALCLSFAMCTTFVFAKPDYNYIEKKQSKNIAEGVVHDSIMQFTSDGVRGINVVKFNLKDASVNIVPLYNANTTSKGAAVSNMVNDHGAVAGINADFFNYKPLEPLGIAVRDGEMIYSNGDTPSVLLDASGNMSFGKLNISMNVVVNGNNIPINKVNKPNKKGESALFTRAWGQNSRGAKATGQVEVAVSNGIVTEKSDEVPLGIPQNGYVLSIKEGAYVPNVGDSVSFNVTGIDLNNTKFAIGAGAVILRDGNIVSEGINIAGRHPRSAMGYNKNTGDVFLVTIDGRSIYHGMTMNEVAETLIALGATDGVNLDGGGSTTMAVRDVNSGKARVKNYIKSQRSVLTGIGVKSSSEVGAPVTMKVITEGDKLFKNTRKWINIELYDAKGNPVKADLSQAKLSSNLPIKIDRHSFMPTESGDMALTVTYGNLNETVNLKVLDAPSVLLLADDTIGLSNGGKYTIKDVYGIDVVGNRALIRADELKKSVVGNVGTIKNNVFIRNDVKANGAIALEFGGAKNRIVVSSSAKKVGVNPLGSAKGLSTTILPKGSKSSIKIVKDKRDVLQLSYNFTNAKAQKETSLVFNGTPTLPDDTTELSIFVKNYGDMDMRAKVIVNGVAGEYNFEENLKLGGYTEFRAKLPGANGIKLQSIVFQKSDANSDSNGSLLVKDVAAVVNPDTSSMFAEYRTLFNDHLKTADLSSTDIAIAVAGKKLDENKITKALASHKKMLVMNKDVNAKNAVKGITQKDANTLFVNFKNTQGGLRASDKRQWNELLTTVKNGAESNILISIDGGSKDELGIINPIERELLKETLEDLVKMGKRVFVITNLKEPTSTRFDEGVRYINLNPAQNEGLYLNINRIGDNVIYAVKRV